jgi:hypothetical protein
LTSKLKTLLGIGLFPMLFGIIALPADAAPKHPLAYATTSFSQFGVVDLITGVFIQRGSVASVPLSGLGEVGGKLYGGGYRNNTLYSVDPSTGALTAIGSDSLTYWATGSTTSALFALDSNLNMNLYSINPATAAAKLIGPTGLSPRAIVEGMSAGSSTLYMTINSSLYRINTTTGAATLIGISPSGLFGPMVVYKAGHADVIFAGAADPSAIWVLNYTNGVGTFEADTTTGASNNFYGLAPDTVDKP